MRVGPTLDQIRKTYPDDVRIVFKQHPLEMHAQAVVAAEAALAAHAQGKFEAMHDALLANSRALSREKIVELASGIGLDMARFEKELDEKIHRRAIALETAEVRQIGATGTPASFVNGRYVRGAKPFTVFKTIIDEELRWHREGKRPAFRVGRHVREVQSSRRAATGRPDPGKVYPLKAGNAPALGSTKPKVTILHYLDYQ